MDFLSVSVETDQKIDESIFPSFLQVLVHVRNKLLSDSAAIHWHGIHQRGTPWMDGVAYISQCPIGPGQTFTYRFKVGLFFKVRLLLFIS